MYSIMFEPGSQPCMQPCNHGCASAPFFAARVPFFSPSSSSPSESNATATHLPRLRSTSAGRWWLVWVSGGRKWVLGSSKATNVACLAVFDPGTNSAISQQPETVKKCPMGAYGPPPLTCEDRDLKCNPIPRSPLYLRSLDSIRHASGMVQAWSRHGISARFRAGFVFNTTSEWCFKTPRLSPPPSRPS
jgi:hypothetical protein